MGEGRVLDITLVGDVQIFQPCLRQFRVLIPRIRYLTQKKTIINIETLIQSIGNHKTIYSLMNSHEELFTLSMYKTSLVR